MMPPELKPGEIFGLEGDAHDDEQKQTKPNNAMVRKGQIIWCQQLFWSLLVAFPPTAIPNSGLGRSSHLAGLSRHVSSISSYLHGSSSPLFHLAPDFATWRRGTERTRMLPLACACGGVVYPFFVRALEAVN